MSPRIHYAALALLLVAGGGCSKARTEAVVVITTDGVRIPDDVEKITLTVADVNDEGSPVFGHDFPICGGGVTDGCFTLPLEFTLIPGPHRDHSSRVEVVATRGGMPVIDDAAIFTFAEGKSLRLDFVLYDNCLGSDCATHDQTCGPDAQCTNVPAVPISGDPDLSASPPDLGSGGDAGADDLSVPAGDLAAADLSMPADLTVHDFANCVPLCVAGTCGDNGCGTPCMCAANQTCQGTTCVANSTDMATTGDKVLNWTASTSYDTGAFYGVWGLSTTVYAVGDPGSANNPIWKHAIAGGDLMFSADTANTVDTTKTLRGIWGTSKTNVYAVGDSATMLRLNTNWSIVALGTNFPASYPLNGVWIGNPGSPTIWAVGGTAAANCTGTSDYNHFGTSWDQPFSTASGCAYGAVWSDGSGNAILVANESLITYSTDDGLDVSDFPLSTMNTKNLHGIWGPTANNLYIVGDAGLIYHFNLHAGLPLYNTETSNTAVALRAVHGSSGSDLWAVGGNQVLHSTGDGNWVAQTNLPNNASDLYGVFAISSTDVYVVGVYAPSGQKIIMHGGP